MIDFDGLHGSDGQGKTFILPLQKGFYPIRAEYFQKGGDRKFDLEYLTPAIMHTGESVSIPVAVQYGKTE